MMIHLLAAEGGGPANPTDAEWLPLVTTIVVFGIAFLILAKFVMPRILGGLEDRDTKIRDEIEAAEKARTDAESAMKEYESSLATARQEASDMIAKARSTAKEAADALRADNENTIAEMKHRATQEIESAKQSAIGELHAEAATLAAAIASKILQREITAEDQQRLVEESLRELQTS